MLALGAPVETGSASTVFAAEASVRAVRAFGALGFRVSDPGRGCVFAFAGAVIFFAVLFFTTEN